MVLPHLTRGSSVIQLSAENKTEGSARTVQHRAATAAEHGRECANYLLGEDILGKDR
jgi:hypothetical protein